MGMLVIRDSSFLITIVLSSLAVMSSGNIVDISSSTSLSTREPTSGGGVISRIGAASGGGVTFVGGATTGGTTTDRAIAEGTEGGAISGGGGATFEVGATSGGTTTDRAIADATEGGAISGGGGGATFGGGVTSGGTTTDRAIADATEGGAISGGGGATLGGTTTDRTTIIGGTISGGEATFEGGATSGGGVTTREATFGGGVISTDGKSSIRVLPESTSTASNNPNASSVSFITGSLNASVLPSYTSGGYIPFSNNTILDFAYGTTNGTGLFLENTGASILTIILCSVIPGFAAIITFLILCLICRRRKKSKELKNYQVQAMLHRRQSICSFNIYDTISIISEDEPVYVNSSSRVRLERSDFILLNSSLIALKRPLENYVVNGVYLDSDRRAVVRELLGLIQTTSSILSDIVCPVMNHETLRFVKALPARFKGTDIFNYANITYELESFNLLKLKLDYTLKMLETGHLEVHRDTGYEHRSLFDNLMNIEAILKIGITNISKVVRNETQVTSDANDADAVDDASTNDFVESDALYDVNPAFKELLDRLITTRFHLETYYELPSIVMKGQWKSRLLKNIDDVSLSACNLFSDVFQTSSIASEHECDAENINVKDFHSLLLRRLEIFRDKLEPIFPEISQFLEGQDSPVGNMIKIFMVDFFSIVSTQDLVPNENQSVVFEISADCMDPVSFRPLTFDDTYQTLPNEQPASSTPPPPLPPTQARLLSYGYRRRREVEEESENSYYDPYFLVPSNPAPAPVLQAPAEDEDNLYSIDEDDYGSYDEYNNVYIHNGFFEIQIDRTSNSWLEKVFQKYVDTTPMTKFHQDIRVSFLAEDGIDGGALSRDFFYRAFNEIINGQPLKSRSMFEGNKKHLLPSIDHVLMDNKAFWFLGLLIMQAVNRGCRGPPGICNAIRHFLSKGAKISTIPNLVGMIVLDDIADLDLRTILHKLEENETLDESEQSCLDQWLLDAKFTKVFNDSTRHEAIQRIRCFYVFDSRMSQLQAILEGMQEIGVRRGGQIQLSQEIDMEKAFSLDEKLTADLVISGVIMEPRELQERHSVYYFKQFCYDLEKGRLGQLTLEDFLLFFTGAPYFTSMNPSRGFFAEAKPEYFFPTARACSGELIIPTVHKNYQDFREAMRKALEMGGEGFGLV